MVSMFPFVGCRVDFWPIDGFTVFDELVFDELAFGELT